jgi:flagellin
MALTVNTNVEAMNASVNLNQTENSLASAMRHLSSGKRINSAADDVAGYAISQRLQAQVNGLNQARLNSQDAVSLAQTAQGALNDVANMLQRLRELAVQYANGTTSATDKEAIEAEATQLKEEIERVGETTQFNGVNLLKEAGKIAFQVGADEGEKIEVSTIALKKEVEGAKIKEVKTIEEALNKVTAAAGSFGSVQNRIQYTESNLEIYSQNLSAAVSGIVDVNMAAEMTKFTSDQVLQQAGVAILAQANQIPDAVLKLVG